MNARVFRCLGVILLVAWTGCSKGAGVEDPGPAVTDQGPADTGDLGDAEDAGADAAEGSGPPEMVFHGCDGPVDLDAVPERKFIVAPYLIHPKTDGITVRWEAVDDGPAYLLWGRDGRLTNCTCAPKPTRTTPIPDPGDDPFDEQNAWTYSVTLTGLEPWTRYDYTLVGALVPTPNATNAFRMEAEWEPFGTAHFRTAPPPGQEYVLLVYGDNQPFTLNQELLTKRMIGLDGDLLLHTGDLVHNGLFVQYRYHYLMVESPLARLVAHLHVSGNHEGHGQVIPFDAYFPVPGGDAVATGRGQVSPGPRTGYLDYGNARFFVMDSERPMDKGSDQLAWLDAMLARTVRESPGTTWLFVSWHRPTYSQADDIWSEEERVALHEVMKRWRVDIVFNGHVHAYERFVQDDVVYVVTGGGGALLNPSLAEGTVYPDDNKVAADLSYHFLRGVVGENRADFEAVRAEDGSPIEAFTVKAKDRSGL